MHTGRSLDLKGSKHVVGMQSKNATTHSYTIQPVVNAEGVLLTPMLLVLKKPQGKFGENVERTLFRVRMLVLYNI